MGIFSPKKPILPGKRFVFDQHANIFTTVTCTPYWWTLSDKCNILNVFWMAAGAMQRDPSFLSSELFWQGSKLRRKLNISIKQIIENYCACPFIIFLAPNCIFIKKLPGLTSLIMQGKKEKYIICIPRRGLFREKSWAKEPLYYKCIVFFFHSFLIYSLKFTYNISF